MPIVEMPDGQKVEFPDDMPKEQIRAAIASKFPELSGDKKSILGKSADIAESVALGALDVPISMGQGLATLMLKPFGVEAPKVDVAGAAPNKLAALLGSLGGGMLMPGGLIGKGIKGAMTEGAIIGGLTGAANDEGLKGAETGAALGLGFGALGKGVGKAKEQILGRSQRTPSQAKALKEAAPEFKTDIFSLMGHPQGREAYTQYLGAVPLSGARTTMEKAVGAEDKIINDILGKMRGDYNPENVPEAIQEAVQKKYMQNEAIKQKNYSSINDIANELGVNVHSRDNLRTPAGKYLKTHNKALQTNNKSAIAKESEALDDLNLSLAPDIEPGTGSPRTMEQSMHTWSSFGEASRRAESEGKKYLAGMYKDLQKSLDKDIDNALEEAGGKELRESWSRAKEHFKTDVLPFRHKSLRGLISENEPYAPDKIHQLLINPKHREVLNKLEPQTKGQIAHQHFIRSAGLDEDGNIMLSSAKMHNAYKSLPDDVKKSLFDESDRNVLNKLAALRDITGEYRTQIKKPPTGARNIAALLSGVSGAGLITNPVLTGKAMLASNLLNKALTSDTLQNLYISGNVDKFADSLVDLLARSGRSATIVQSRKDKE